MKKIVCSIFMGISAVAAMNGEVIVITTDAQMQEIVMKAEKPVILDVYTPWCGPCKKMVPIIEELEKELGSSYIFAKVNAEQLSSIIEQFKLKGVPAFIFIRNGVVEGKEVGFMNKKQLKEKIEGYFTKE